MTSSKIREAFEHWVRTNERFKFDDVSLDRCEDGFYMECRAEEMFVAWKAALHSVEAEKEPEWISCEDRLPTEEDGDCDLCVWAFNPRRGVASKIKPDSVEGVNFTHWMPTGLVRPAPPEHKPE